MKMSLLFAPAVAAALALASCTPKAPSATSAETAPRTNTPTKPPAPAVKLSDCPKFSDAPNPDQITDDYVIYRDFIKTGQVDRAYELWQKVYAVAPAADGQRNTVIADGIYFMEYFASQTTDATKQAEYRDKVFEFYDVLDRCYPEGGYVPSRKGFDYFYKYPGTVSKKENYDYFVEAIKRDSMDVGDFVLNPTASLLVDLHDEKVITDAEAKRMGQFLLARLDKEEADAKTAADRERLALIAGYLPERLSYFETVKGFYDCAYYKERYLPELEANPDDCTLLSQLSGYLRYGGCADTDPDLARITAQYNEKCRTLVSAGDNEGGCRAYDLLRNGDYRDAVACFERRYEAAESSSKKADIALTVAKVYYGNLRNFSQSRAWARKAASNRGGWGEPYILIGKLYASSGPLCGSGRGFDSQTVVWAAIDQWNRARSVDSGVSGEASRLINSYSKYLPSKGDMFQRGIKEGESFTVGCWIGESTTARGI